MCIVPLNAGASRSRMAVTPLGIAFDAPGTKRGRVQSVGVVDEPTKTPAAKKTAAKKPKNSVTKA